MTPTLKAKLREELGSLTSDAKLDRVYRAVLEGIREPTHDQCRFGSYAEVTPIADQYTQEIGEYAAAEAYRAMIDALLSQGEAVE